MIEPSILKRQDDKARRMAYHFMKLIRLLDVAHKHHERVGPYGMTWKMEKACQELSTDIAQAGHKMARHWLNVMNMRGNTYVNPAFRIQRRAEEVARNRAAAKWDADVLTAMPQVGLKKVQDP